MRIAVISDIHGNMEALTAVLDDIDTSAVDDIVCLGDIIGYGPQPREVIACLKKNRIPSVLGNHELAVLNEAQIAYFNPHAKISIKKTISLLTDDDKAFILSMPFYLKKSGCRFVHGFPPESATTYLFQVTTEKLISYFERFTDNICFVGHTHQLEIISFNGHDVERAGLRKGTVALEKEKRYIINVGSVGQPRDGNHHAKYAIFDTSAYTLEIKFISYDISAVVEKLSKGGWPEIHALRLM